MIQTSMTTRLAALLQTQPTDLTVHERPAMLHQSNRLYDLMLAGRHLIVKEYLQRDEHAVGPVREVRGLTLAAPHGLAPVAVAMAPAAADMAPLVVYEFLEGMIWDRHPASRVELTAMADSWLTMARLTPQVDWESRHRDARVVQTMARFRDVFVRYGAWCRALFPPGEAAALLCLRLLEERRGQVEELMAYTPPLRFCRGDPRFANVVARPDGRIAFVDWEDCGLRDPAMDIGDLMTHPNQEDLVAQEDWLFFLDHYAAHLDPPDPAIHRRVEHYAGLFPFFWLSLLLGAVLRQAERGEALDWSVNGLPVRVRLQRQLARAMSWPDGELDDAMERCAQYVFLPPVEEGGD